MNEDDNMRGRECYYWPDEKESGWGGVDGGWTKGPGEWEDKDNNIKQSLWERE